MTTQIDGAVGSKLEDLVDDFEKNGGEITLTRDGKTVAKLARVESAPEVDSPVIEGRVLYNGRWMIPAAAERERSIEHLRGSGKVVGDIVSPIDDVEWDTYE
ncbi:MAG: hypothetical protein QOC81_3263 [Thermoanaerobaculia bacterium]|jgi:antitoxin (DNA-binding transcriptional repressor) of toxin-antitoxin stability system|nr:hypothetical protein [Thermoanaerobaculia bacterium]